MKKQTGNLLCINNTISKETSIYYVSSDNSFGYEIKSVESENNKLLDAYN